MDFNCDATSFRFQTRTDGGVDLVLFGKDDRSGTICHLKCDLAAAVSAMSNCMNTHKFEGVREVGSGVVLRGSVDASSDDLSIQTTYMAALPQDTARLNREKWEREVDYLERCRQFFEGAASSCKGTLSSFGKRVLRGRA